MITISSVFQRESDGKVEINYAIDTHGVKESGEQLLASFEYWDGSVWVACSSVTGDVGEIEEGDNQAVWDAKTDKNGWYYEECKIKVKIEGISIESGYDYEKESDPFAVDTKTPVITGPSPADEAIQTLLSFVFGVDVEEDNDYLIKFQVSILGAGDFDPLYETDWLENEEEWNYTLDVRPLQYGFWYWRVIVIDKYKNQTTSGIWSFELRNQLAEVIVNNVEKLYDGSGIAIINYSVRDTNSEKISLRFEYTDDGGDTYRPCKIIESSSGIINEDFYITGISATPSWTTHNVKFKYADDAELQLITKTLKQKELKVEGEIFIERNGIEYNISEMVLGITLSTDRQFGAAQLVVDGIDKDSRYNPENKSSDLNYTNGKYDPLLHFGNRIKSVIKVLTDEGIKTYTNFIGRIKKVEVLKIDAANRLNILALDDLEKLINYRPHQIEYKTTLEPVVGEILRTFDGVSYESEHTSWSEYPAPIIKVNEIAQQQDKYMIDFIRGQILWKGSALALLNLKEEETTNPSLDRQTWVIGVKLDSSILPKVYYVYDKYIEIGEADYYEEVGTWQTYIEELTEFDDYFINYEEGVVYLYDPLAPDDPEVEFGNINNQKIVVNYRIATTITADYYYEIPGTNEVEDIIRDLAVRGGVSSDNIKDTISDEILCVRNNDTLYTSKNNIIDISVKRNGDAFSDYEIDKKTGTLTLDSLDYNERDKMLDDCDYLWDEVVANESGESVIQELDTSDKMEGSASLKVIFPINGGYVLRNLLNNLYNVTFSSQKYLEFYVKANKSGTIYFDVGYDGINWETNEVAVTTDWGKISWDVSGFSEAFKDVKYLRIRATNIEIKVDNIYIKRNQYTAIYSYWTLQSTGITLSKIYFDYENTENAYEGIQEVLKHVAPNYIIFIESGKLIGFYSSQKLLRNCITPWDNVRYGSRGYSSSYYGEEYQIQLPKHLSFNISDEEVYTGVLVLGKNNEPRNAAIDGTVSDVCSWAAGHGYGMIRRSGGLRTVFGSPILSSGFSIFRQLANQTTYPVEGNLEALNDMDTSSGVFWYRQNVAPAPHLLICELELEKPILWDKVDILVGAYEGAVIQEAMVIKVGDEDRNFWYTEKNVLRQQGGSTGTWLTFENRFNEDVPIKYVQIYMVAAWEWTVTTAKSKTVFLSTKTTIKTDYHYVFSIAEIQVWEKPLLIAQAPLDSCILVGDGSTTEVQLPNTPFKTKDYLLKRWGWIEKFPSSIKLYKNSLADEMDDVSDYFYDNETGKIEFAIPPATGDVICASYTLDEKRPKETTFYASFANIELLKKIGLKYYKEVDSGLYSHEKSLQRAKWLLPEMTRSVYPSSLNIIFRPDIKIGQSLLIKNEELDLKRIFYIDSINYLLKEKFIPNYAIGLTSFLELKDYAYQQIDSEIYTDFKIRYPQYLPAWASFNRALENNPTKHRHWYYTGLISIEALDDDGGTKLDYNQECKLEILEMEDSTTFKLAENTVKSEMWENGFAELNFFLQWNRDGAYDSTSEENRATLPTELVGSNKWYVDKIAKFRFYEIDNPSKNRIFSTKIRIYLTAADSGTIPNYVNSVRNLGAIVPYENYYDQFTLNNGKIIVSDVYDNHSVLADYDYYRWGVMAADPFIFDLTSLSGSNNYQIKRWSWESNSWVNYGAVFTLGGTVKLVDFFAGKVLLMGSTPVPYFYLYDGKTLNQLSLSYANNKEELIFNNQLWVAGHSMAGPETWIYDINGTEIFHKTQSPLPLNWAARVSLFSYIEGIYMIQKQMSTTLTGFAIRKWNASTELWDTIYHYSHTTRDLPAPYGIINYRNKIYFLMAPYHFSKFIMPFIGEYDFNTNQIYNKGYLVNIDWGLEASRESETGRSSRGYFFTLQGNIYMNITQSAVGHYNPLLKNVMPILQSDKRELIYSNQL